ncbi:Elongation factor G [Clostridioides difficile]|nr:Elongation factor G [Clostridioides difficile]
MEPKDSDQEITAEIPLSEISRYVTELRSITHGSGNFKKEFLRYEEVPEMESNKIIENLNSEEK